MTKAHLNNHVAKSTESMRATLPPKKRLVSVRTSGSEMWKINIWKSGTIDGRIQSFHFGIHQVSFHVVLYLHPLNCSIQGIFDIFYFGRFTVPQGSIINCARPNDCKETWVIETPLRYQWCLSCICIGCKCLFIYCWWLKSSTDWYS